MTQFNVTGIGNAIVDILAQTTDAFLEEHQLDKGGMMLVDGRRAETLYQQMGPAIERSGGSAGNTLAGLASLGGTGAYIGKVKNDGLGEVFARDLRQVGIRFDTEPASDSAPTARCLVFVTPDAQRTLVTYLGACVELGPNDIDPALIRSSQVTYLEGYLFDPPQAKAAFWNAARTAHEAGRKVSLSLSDAFCVERHRDEFLELVEHHVDILFANESEICALYRTDRFEDAARHVSGSCEVAALTRSERGSVLLGAETTLEVPAVTVPEVVDTTGAGDLYAAGFLFGYTAGRPLGDCGKLGAIAAAEVISHFGARPETQLKQLVER